MKTAMRLTFFLACLICLTGNAQVSFTLTTSPPTCSTCCNGSFTVSVSGCSGYTVGTNPMAGIPTIMGSNWIYNNVCSNTYTVTVLGVNPCTSLAKLCNMNFTTCATPITFSLNQTPATCSTCCDGSVTITNIQNGCPAYSSSISPVASSAGFGAYNNLCAGTNYTVSVADGGCCGPTAMVCSMSYNMATGINESNTSSAAVIISTSENGNFKLLLPKNLPYPDKIIIRNSNGKEIASVCPARAYEIDLDLFEKEPAGVYIISVIYSDKIITKKIVKR